ncbi:MAG TPA: thioredoxin domain-containing protein [Candidatus Paceibacterota bacterium]|nr:thioredoxin domain-containing protein [Candidatus Paceibacterota bacterium]
MNQHDNFPEEESNVSEEMGVTASRGGRSRDLFLPVSILVAAIVVGGAIVFATLYKGGGAPAAPAGTGATPTSTTMTAAQIMTLSPRDAILGDASATVTLIEYGDYQCPYCGEFFSQTEPEIVQNYVNTGKVRMVFRNFAFLGPESTAAAEAADCAEDQNKLWAYHDALYSAKVADDANGGTEDDGFFSTAELLKLGQQVGLDMPTFTSCVNNNTDANLVAQEKADAANAGVNSTPSFFVNGTVITGAEPYTTFQQALDSALQG